jgi:hypothetical protein
MSPARRHALAVAAASVLALSAARARSAEPDVGRAPEARAIVDRVAVRFYAPETGGATHPRFITERTLAFEARLDALGEPLATGQKLLDDRRLQSALDRHVAEELLASLFTASDATAAEEATLTREAHADLEQRAGGDGPIWVAAEEEGLDGAEVEAFFSRRARAAAHLDHAIGRFLHPPEDQLREVYRTTQHPFRDRPYDDVRAALSRWLVFERLKAMEQAFLQTARSRVTVVIVPR